jgi:hypothetical protein
MKYTLYGLFSSIAIFVGGCFIEKNHIKLLILLLAVILIQSRLCRECDKVYSMASFMSVLPLMASVFFNCNNLKEIIFAFAILAAIGRIGCYFAGCCHGQITDKKEYTIEYKEDYLCNTKFNKKVVHVQPTIFIEILSQFAIAFLVYQNKYGVQLFGILSILLMFGTNKWREEKRMDNNKKRQFSNYIPLIGLFLYTLISFIKCKAIDHKPKFRFKIIYVIISIIFGLIVSNDINIKDFNDFFKLKSRESKL